MNNKEFKSINNKNNNEISLKRDSFSDRILKYFSFEHKIKFECISKQLKNIDLY